MDEEDESYLIISTGMIFKKLPQYYAYVRSCMLACMRVSGFSSSSFVYVIFVVPINLHQARQFQDSFYFVFHDNYVKVPSVICHEDNKNKLDQNKQKLKKN